MPRRMLPWRCCWTLQMRRYHPKPAGWGSHGQAGEICLHLACPFSELFHLGAKWGWAVFLFHVCTACRVVGGSLLCSGSLRHYHNTCN